MAKKAQPKGIKKIKQQTFYIDCTKPVEDKIMEIASLQKFLTDRIKVNGKTGNSPKSIEESIMPYHRLPDDLTALHNLLKVYMLHIKGCEQSSIGFVMSCQSHTYPKA